MRKSRKSRILIHLDVSSNPKPFPRSFEEVTFRFVGKIIKIDDQRAAGRILKSGKKREKKGEIVINLGRDIGFNIPHTYFTYADPPIRSTDIF